jgi:predicted ATPase/DNA-binding CsgD family transcriptional regulator
LPRTPLIGRADEIASLRALLTDPTSRLLTVTGVGGTGKTCLALKVAEDARRHFVDGMWLVELAPLTDPELVADRVVAALRVPEGRVEPLAAMLAYLREKRLLLLLDNCEHVIDACAALVTQILAAAPGVRLLLTSREPLLIAGERHVRIAPLAAPESDDVAQLTVEDVAGYAAVQLFVERARAAAPGLRLDAVTAPAIGEICSRLAGIPLAIELAAARLRALTLPQLVERLGDTFQLLAGNSRMTPTRQQTLRASLDWSHALLPEAEQQVFSGLAVFVGGCELGAAECVCDLSNNAVARPTMLDLITALVDKSLVVMDAQGPVARYRFLEPVRQYAHERLEAGGEEAPTRRRHARYYVELAERAARHVRGPAQVAWLARLDRDHDNARAALTWALAEPDTELLLRLAVALVRFWEIRGHLVEGRRWLEQAVQLGGASVHPELRPRAQLGVGRMALWQADSEAALSAFEQALGLARRLDRRSEVAEALTFLGTAFRRQGTFDRADEALRRGLALHEALGDRPGAAWAQLNLAVITVNLCDIEQCDWAQARSPCETALAGYRALGDVREVGVAALLLGWVVARLGEHALCVSLLGEGLAALRAVGDRSYLLPNLLTVAAVAAELGQPRRTARLLGAAEALAELLGATGVAPVTRAEEARALEAMRGRLTAGQLLAARTEGRALAPDAVLLEAEAAVQALSNNRRPPPDPRTVASETLTRREQDVARLLAAGYSDRKIAAELGIAPGTATVHVHHVLRKLGLRSRWQVDRQSAVGDAPMPVPAPPVESI